MTRLNDQERIALGKKIFKEQGITGMKHHLLDDCVCMGFVQAQFEAHEKRPRTSGFPDV